MPLRLASAQSGAVERAQALGQRLMTSSAESLPALGEDLGTLLLELQADAQTAGDSDTLAGLYLTGQMILGLPSSARPEKVGLESLFAIMYEATTGLEQPDLRAKVAVQESEWLRTSGRLSEARARIQRELEEPAEAIRYQAMLLFQKGVLLMEGGDADAASLAFLAAEEVLDPDADDPSVAAFHRGLLVEILRMRGTMHLDQGRPDRAAAPLERALQESRRLGDVASERSVILALIALDLAAENVSSALDRVDHLLGQSGEPLAPVTEALLLARRGIALAEIARDDPSVGKTASEALRTALQHEALSPEEEFDVRVALAEVELRRGHLKEADELLVVASSLLSSEAQRAASGLALRRRVRLATVRAALLLSEEQDAESLLASLEEVEEVYRLFIAEWDASAAHEDGRGLLHFGGPRALLSEIIRLHLVLDGERGASRGFEQLLKAQALGTVTKRRGGRALLADEVRDDLAPGEALLVYLPTPERSHVFFVSRDGILHRELAGDMELFAKRSAFLSLVTRPPPGKVAALEQRMKDWRDVGGSLRDALLPDPLWEFVSGPESLWTQITVVGSELLGTVPFEALPTETDVPLGVLKAIRYLPSVPLGHVLGKNTPRDGRALSLLAATRTSGEVRKRFGGLSDLEFGSDRIGRISEAYEEDHHEAVVGGEATASRLIQLTAGAGAVLQIWAHGFFDARALRPAGLVLSPDSMASDGLLSGDMVEELLSPPPVVVLAACGAARGPVRRGEDGVSHLGGAFLSAGADTVLLPSAAVEGESTFRLLEAFHRELKQGGATPAEAMRTARKELWSDPRFSDPYYHSLVHVIGAGHSPVFARTASGYERSLLIMALVAVVIFVIMFLRRRH